MSHPIPFMKASNVATSRKVAKEAPDLEEAIEEEDEAEVAEPVEADDDDLDLKGDKYIKQPKAKAKRGPKKAANGGDEADDVDNDDEATKGTKSRGQGKAGGGRGKVKK